MPEGRYVTLGLKVFRDEGVVVQGFYLTSLIMTGTSSLAQNPKPFNPEPGALKECGLILSEPPGAMSPKGPDESPQSALGFSFKYQSLQVES